MTPGAEVFGGCRLKHRQAWHHQDLFRATRSKFKHIPAQQKLSQPLCDAEVPALNHKGLLSAQGCWSLERAKTRGTSQGDFCRAAEVGQQDEGSIPLTTLEGAPRRSSGSAAQPGTLP